LPQLVVQRVALPLRAALWLPAHVAVAPPALFLFASVIPSVSPAPSAFPVPFVSLFLVVFPALLLLILSAFQVLSVSLTLSFSQVLSVFSSSFNAFPAL
jgi:hypothetical protein